MRLGVTRPHDVGDYVLAEVMTRGWICKVFFQHLVEVVGIEDVDAHAGQRYGVIARHRRRLWRLFHKLEDAALTVDGHHAERRSFGARDFDAAHGALGPAVDVVLEHDGVVHFVDMVPGQDHYILRLVGLNDVDVLVDRIRSAAVPVLVIQPLLRRQ